MQPTPQNDEHYSHLHTAAAADAVVATDAPPADGKEPPEGTVTVHLCVENGEPGGEPVRILPARMWRGTAMRALNSGDFDRWAELCLFGDDYMDVWHDLDPTNEEMMAFAREYRKVAGESLGQSRAVRRSARSRARQ